MRLLSSSVFVTRSCAKMYFLLSPQLCLCLSSWFVFVSLNPLKLNTSIEKNPPQKPALICVRLLSVSVHTIGIHTLSFKAVFLLYANHKMWFLTTKCALKKTQKGCFLDVTWCAQICSDRPRQPSNDHRYTRKTKSQPYARASLRHQGQWEPTSPVSHRV